MRARWTLGSVVALVLLAGCPQLRIATGPRIAPPDLELASVADGDLETADHRTKDRLRFLVVGDAGTGGGPGSSQARVGRLMADTCADLGGCDFAIGTGDNIYPDGVESEDDSKFKTHFEDPYSALGRFDFWMVTGNHDWYRSGSAAAEVRYSTRSERWRMPALDYAVARLPPWISIYGLDTTLLQQGEETGQVERAKEALCGAGGWRIAFGHHGFYTVGHHGDRSGTIAEIERALLEPLIEACAVHVYFAGHDHLQAHVSATDFEQIIQGAGGRRLHKIKVRAGRPAGVSVASARRDFGFSIVEADAETLRISFYGLSDAGESFYCTQMALDTFATRPRVEPCSPLQAPSAG